METQQIPHDEWQTFFDAFSRQHEGWLASLEIFAREIGAQEQTRELPFEGISITAANGDPETIAISLGKVPEHHLTHTIARPKSVWLQQTAEGANAALEIESEDEKALLRFRSALLPEMVDGVVLG